MCSRSVAWFSCGSNITGVVPIPKVVAYVGYVLLVGMPFLGSVGKNVLSIAGGVQSKIYIYILTNSQVIIREEIMNLKGIWGRKGV